MLPYLIGLLGFLLIVVGAKYSGRHLALFGKDIDPKSIMAFGVFILALAVLLKLFNVQL